MAVDPKKLVAAISPKAYCDGTNLDKDKIEEIKEKLTDLIKESGEDPSIKTIKDAVEWANKTGIKLGKKDAYIKSAGIAKLKESEFIDFDEVVKTPFELLGIKNPVEEHTLEYDTSSQALEQVYFWLHDYLESNKVDYGVAVEKLVDNFVSSPGSAHFSETGAKATRMQEEGMKILGVANTLIKSILNLIYDLKEFKLRLEIYDDYKGKDENKKESAYLSLKQLWIDQVDIKRGSSSIKALAVSGANAPNFVVLIDAFMVAKSLSEIKTMDLNERVLRLLEQRFGEFERWLTESDKELRKRYEIEKIYLKSQLNTVKLYSRWAKPYLKAAAQLEQRAASTSALVSLFSTSLFELTLLGVGDYRPERDVARGELPSSFKGANKRKYAPVVLVELKFRSIPERFQQQGGYGFRGKAEITFTSFALNDEERKTLKEQLDLDDFKDVYTIISGATEESLGQLQLDIDEILGESEKKEGAKKEFEETNPFSALFSIVTDLFNKRGGQFIVKKGEKGPGIAPDSGMEEVMRSQAGLEARRRCRKFYDSFKKANNSPAF